jgi:hypothetical protein
MPTLNKKESLKLVKSMIKKENTPITRREKKMARKISKINEVIPIVNLNEEKLNTCGSCHYTNNNLGIVALHCTCKKKEAKGMWHDEYGKVRSWNTCKRWRKR